MRTMRPETSAGGAPRLDRLTEYECWQLVSGEARGGLARVVWCGPDGPAVVPVNFTVADGVLWFQTTPGSRLAAEVPEREVLVELDRYDPATRLGWSVIVAGSATRMPASADPGLLADLLVAPGGTREVLVRVEPVALSGRRLRRPRAGLGQT